MSNTSLKKVDHLIILVHGIRDIGRWQSDVRAPLEQYGFAVELTNYDRMNLVEFLIPLPLFRNIAKQRVLTQIRQAISLHPNSKVSIIAHSFGTYVISRILVEAFDLKFHKIIFCGSVVRYDFPFEQLAGRFTFPVLNDVGTRDPWPAIAESVTFGFGSAGTYGFRVPGVRDRFQNNAGHGYFLDVGFCRDNWIPFLEDQSTYPLGDNPAAIPPLWVRALSIFKIRYLLCLVFLLIMLLGIMVNIWPKKSYVYNFNASDSPYTYWNQPVRELLRNVNEPCDAPLFICRSSWIRSFTLEREYLPVTVIDNDISRIVSCKSFTHPPKTSSDLVEHDPTKALLLLAETFPACISVQRSASATLKVKIHRQNLVAAERPGGDTVLFCDCNSEQIFKFR